MRLVDAQKIIVLYNKLKECQAQLIGLGLADEVLVQALKNTGNLNVPQKQCACITLDKTTISAVYQYVRTMEVEILKQIENL